jgi:hypothetical protein
MKWLKKYDMRTWACFNRRMESSEEFNGQLLLQELIHGVSYEAG